LAQLGTAPQHRIDGIPWRERKAGVDGMVRRCSFVVALAAAVVAPVLQLTGAVYAQVDMGESWRIGVDPSETTTLVRTGVFGLVRNPIFTAMITFGFGIALVTPNLVAIAGFVLLVITIELQVRVVEEPYLQTVHGDAYRDYLVSVGRFVPGVGRAR
jgi:protein-S-isoprenylcysteine O-methyltransferase Ste14